MWHKIKDNLLTILSASGAILTVLLFFNGSQGYLCSGFLSFKKTLLLFGLIFIIVFFLDLERIYSLLQKRKSLKTKKYLLSLLYDLIILLFTICIYNFFLFHCYIEQGSIKQIKRYLNLGYKPTFYTIAGNDALLLASEFNREKEVFELLIEKGANVNCKTYANTSCLMDVISNKNIEAAKLLIKNGADVNYQEPRKQNTALIYALNFIKNAEKQIEIVKLLIDTGVDVNAKSKNGGTALYLATTLYNQSKENMSLQTIELLLEAGANPFLNPNENLLSPYETAQKYENKELIELFDKYKDKFIIKR